MPAEASASKIKKTPEQPAPVLDLVPTTDVLAELAAHRARAGQVVVGFAAETGGDGRSVLELDGSLTNWEYDQASRLKREHRQDASGTSLWDARFFYDGAGNRLAMQEAVSGETVLYAYRGDGTDQVAGAFGGPEALQWKAPLHQDLTEVQWRLTRE